MEVRLAGAVAPDELGLRVALDVVLVTVVGFVVLFRPPRVGVLLAEFRGFLLPFLRNPALPDGPVLLTPVALAGHFDEAGINDNALLRMDAKAGQVRVEDPEETRHALRAELVLEIPDGVLVGHFVARGEVEEAHEAEAVADLELGLLLGEAEVFLKNGDTEHEDRIERGVASLVLAVPVAEDVEKLVAEDLEIDEGLEFVEGAGLFGGQLPGVSDLGEEVFLAGGGLLESHTRTLVVPGGGVKWGVAGRALHCLLSGYCRRSYRAGGCYSGCDCRQPRSDWHLAGKLWHDAISPTCC